MCTVTEDEETGRSFDCVPADLAVAGEKGFRLVGTGPWLPGGPADAGAAYVPTSAMSVSTSRAHGWWALAAFGLGVVALGAVARRPSRVPALITSEAIEQPASLGDRRSLEDLVRRVDERPMEGSAAFELAMRLFELNDERGLRYLTLAVRLEPLVLLPFLREPAYERARGRPEVRRFLRGVQREREQALVSYA